MFHVQDGAPTEQSVAGNGRRERLTAAIMAFPSWFHQRWLALLDGVAPRRYRILNPKP